MKKLIILILMMTLMQAADRLEELDERVAIMSEDGEQVTMTDILRDGL